MMFFVSENSTYNLISASIVHLEHKLIQMTPKDYKPWPTIGTF
jgi:hypothetical protein